MTDQDENLYHFTESSPEEREHYAHMAAESTRAIRMRGLLLPLAGVMTVLLLCALTPAWYGAFLGNMQPIACLIFGAFLSLFAIPCHLLGGNRNVIGSAGVRSVLYVVGILINTAGTSLSMTAYYLHLGKLPTQGDLILGGCCAVLLFGVTALCVLLWSGRYQLVSGLVGLTTLGLWIVSTVFWIRTEDKALWSMGFFLLLWVGIAVISLCAACSDEDSPWLRFASFASFGLLLIVAVVVLIILLCAGGGDCSCDGDCGCGDCCDCGGGDKPKKIKKR